MIHRSPPDRVTRSGGSGGWTAAAGLAPRATRAGLFARSIWSWTG